MKIIMLAVYAFAFIVFALSNKGFFAFVAFMLFLMVGTLIGTLGGKNKSTEDNNRDSQNLEDLATIERARYFRKPLN